MDIFSFLREHGSPPSPTDEILYEFVAAELTNSMLKHGLWTKALSDSNWDEAKAKALYVKMRISQLRSELLAEVIQRQTLLSDPKTEALSFGLSEKEIEYLGMPIKAIRYVKKYGMSEEKLSKAIGQGKIRGVLCRDILWVQDKKTA